MHSYLTKSFFVLILLFQITVGYEEPFVAAEDTAVDSVNKPEPFEDEPEEDSSVTEDTNSYADQQEDDKGMLLNSEFKASANLRKQYELYPSIQGNPLNHVFSSKDCKLELKVTCDKAPSSCQEVLAAHPASKSGYYKVRINGKEVQVYCNMDTLCGAKGGWTRLAYLDMTKSQQSCPTGFKLYTANGVRACGRKTSNDFGCQSVKFPSNGISYNRICGRVIGYQFATTDAVEPGLWKRQHYVGGVDPKHNDINSAYVDGVSITRGSPRKHVWTLMAGLQEKYLLANGRFNCPCSVGSLQKVQSFIGSDYFCESGNPYKHNPRHLYTNDPLWDGKKCGTREQKCCQAPGLPWFSKTLQGTTTDHLELRVCADQEIADEDAPVSFYEIYVM